MNDKEAKEFNEKILSLITPNFTKEDLLNKWMDDPSIYISFDFTSIIPWNGILQVFFDTPYGRGQSGIDANRDNTEEDFDKVLLRKQALVNIIDGRIWTFPGLAVPYNATENNRSTGN